jgi:hypothetical protein
MNQDIVKIADRIARNEDISMDEFNKLSRYISKANSNKSWNTDDVFSNFVLDVRQNYNPDFDKKAKEAWIYAHIKHAITTQSRFDSWTLYSPLPVAVDCYEMDWWSRPDRVFEEKLEKEKMNEFYWTLRNQFEKDIYINCILWDTPAAHIAKEYWKSTQWWNFVKDKILKKIKEHIENEGE